MTHRIGFVTLCLVVTPAIGAPMVSQIPTPGCYQVDMTATIVKSGNGQPQAIQVATLDGETGNYRLTASLVGGPPTISEQAGTGPFLRDFRPSAGRTTPNCPTTLTNPELGAFDFKSVCETFAFDPGRLTFTRIESPLNKWRVTLRTTVTSQVGLNNLPAAMRETTSTLDRVYANATPTTEAERRQIAQSRAGISRLKADARANAPAMERQRRQLEAQARSAPPRERAALQAALDGGRITQTVNVEEIWTPSTRSCGS
jgi:hypothetical protein